MKRKAKFALTAIMTIPVMLMVLAGGAGTGVDQDGYPVGDLTASPGTGVCIGDTIIRAAPAGAALFCYCFPAFFTTVPHFRYYGPAGFTRWISWLPPDWRPPRCR